MQDSNSAFPGLIYHSLASNLKARCLSRKKTSFETTPHDQETITKLQPSPEGSLRAASQGFRRQQAHLCPCLGWVWGWSQAARACADLSCLFLVCDLVSFPPFPPFKKGFSKQEIQSPWDHKEGILYYRNRRPTASNKRGNQDTGKRWSPDSCIPSSTWRWQGEESTACCK